MSGSWRSALKRASAAFVLGALVTAFTVNAAGQTAARRIATIRAITLVPGTDSARVVIETDLPVAEPSAGFAHNPPRIYLDFVDVLPGQPIEPLPENPFVRRMRAAEHNPEPLVTRVVLDLTKPIGYRVDLSQAGKGRITVMVGGTDAPPPPPRPQASQPQQSTQSKPAAQTAASGRGEGTGDASRGRGGVPSTGQAAPTPTQPAAPAVSSGAVEKAYDVRVSAALVRLHALRPVLESIDRQLDPLPGDLDAALSEFEAIGKVLSGIRPPRSRQVPHGLLQTTCTMGTNAVRLRLDGARTSDPRATLNAASAAAGALLMLDRANKELAGEGR